MTAKRKVLLAVLAAVVVLTAGAFAWKSSVGVASNCTAASAGKPAERPIELIGAELHTIKPRGLVDIVRFTGTTQPIDQTIVKATRRRPARRGAGARGRPGIKDQFWPVSKSNELRSKVDERQSALGAASRGCPLG